jgi:hypothetical protein
VNAPIVRPSVDTPAEPSAELIPRWNYGRPLARLSRELSRILRRLRRRSRAVPDDRQPRDAALDAARYKWRRLSRGESHARSLASHRACPAGGSSDGRDESRP